MSKDAVCFFENAAGTTVEMSAARSAVLAKAFLLLLTCTGGDTERLRTHGLKVRMASFDGDRATFTIEIAMRCNACGGRLMELLTEAQS